jgi:hypothetical protein
MNISITTQEILERISRHCPEAMSTYLHCLSRADDEGTIHFTKEKIDIDLSENFRTFRNNIKKLARENLLEWAPLNGGLSIIMAEHYEDE